MSGAGRLHSKNVLTFESVYQQSIIPIIRLNLISVPENIFCYTTLISYFSCCKKITKQISTARDKLLQILVINVNIDSPHQIFFDRYFSSYLILYNSGGTITAHFLIVITY